MIKYTNNIEQGIPRVFTKVLFYLLCWCLGGISTCKKKHKSTSNSIWQDVL